MYLSKRAKVVAGVSALLGVVVAGSAAFTATGVYDNAGPSQFVGGTVTQTVSGGTALSSIVYSYADNTPGAGGSIDTEINEVTLTFGDNIAEGLTPTIAFTGTDGGADAGFEYLSADWLCIPIPSSSPYVSTCSPTGDLASGQDYATDVTGISVTVPSNNVG